MFNSKPIAIQDFTSDECRTALTLYAARFNFDVAPALLTDSMLHNPLMLRLFAETNQGMNAVHIDASVHATAVFQRYLVRIAANLVERLAVLEPLELLNGFLVSIAGAMWNVRSSRVDLSTIGITGSDRHSAVSLYNVCRLNNIVVEDETGASYADVHIRFLYDRFMEYMLGEYLKREIFAAVNSEATLERVLIDAVDAIPYFHAVLGAIVFLDRAMAGSRIGSLSNTSLVNRFIILCSVRQPQSFVTEQSSIAYAFEHVDAATADDALIKLLDKFEAKAHPLIKGRLTSVILRLAREKAREPAMAPILHRVLDTQPRGVGRMQKHDGAKRTAADEQRETPRRKNAVAPPFHALVDRVRRWLSHLQGAAVQDMLDRPRLPPARYHYADETKLTAISLLIECGGEDHIHIVADGIRQLGRVDLHSALRALENLDVADDHVVFDIIRANLERPQPEYHVYSAWLLRDRYGPVAADFILQLLTSPVYRVHQYAFRLFETRAIDKHLLSKIIERVRTDDEIAPWHVVHFIKLLGYRGQMRDVRLAEEWLKSIVECLMKYTTHPNSSIRFESYRALLQYPEGINLTEILNAARSDADIYVRSVSEHSPTV
jgi:hypothetical protein